MCFFHAWLASGSDWFIGLFSSIVISQSNSFGVGIMHSIENHSYVVKCNSHTKQRCFGEVGLIVNKTLFLAPRVVA